MKKHRIELFMLNKFQQTVQDEDVEWDINNNKDIKMMKALSHLIRAQQSYVIYIHNTYYVLCLLVFQKSNQI